MSIGLATSFLYCHAGSASRPVKRNIFGSGDSRRKEKVKNKKAKEFLELLGSVFGFIVYFYLLLLPCSGGLSWVSWRGKKRLSLAWQMTAASPGRFPRHSTRKGRNWPLL